STTAANAGRLCRQNSMRVDVFNGDLAPKGLADAGAFPRARRADVDPGSRKSSLARPTTGPTLRGLPNRSDVSRLAAGPGTLGIGTLDHQGHPRIVPADPAMTL